MSAAPPLLLRGGRIVDPARGRPFRGDLFLRHGRIARLGRRPLRPPVRTIDARGLYVAPGLIDLQVNGAPGCSFGAAERTQSERALDHHAAAGTTGLLATLVTDAPRRLSAALDVLGRLAHPALLGVHLEGPFIAPARAGAHPRAHVQSPSVHALEALIGGRGSLVRLLTLAPELPGAAAVVRAARSLRIAVAAGHSDADYPTAMRAFAAGVVLVSHLWNAQPPLHHRAPGLVGAALEAPVTVSLICDGVHLHPAAVNLTWRLKGPSKVCLVSDAVARPRRRHGTLTGTSITLLEAMRNLIAFTDCSLPEALRAASLCPAELLGLGYRKGSIQAGKDADLILLDKKLALRGVILGGVVLGFSD